MRRRSDYPGELRREDVGRQVRLCGWVARRRDHGGVIFVDLRDRSGLVQLVFNPQIAAEAHGAAEQLRTEYVLAVAGEVLARSAATVNPNLATGEVEVMVSEIEVLNGAHTPPFEIEGGESEGVDETLRLRYRYLDLRRPPMMANLELRHRVVQTARAYLNEQRFLEVETPILTRSTPEGARDFLVPSRLQPHKFYALPQSPQIFKQILMASGVDRYYQIARCFRDEDLRADRQPEHTQIDLEVSFMDAEEIRALIEGMCLAIMSEVEGGASAPFPVLTYEQAMLRYGTDKPDLRYEVQIVELSAVFAASAFQVFRAAAESGGCVRALCAPGGASLSRAQIDALTEVAKAQGAKGMAYVYVEEGRALRGPIVKFLSQAEQTAVVERCGAAQGDLIVFAADAAPVAARVLGALRGELIRRLALRPALPWAWAWVIEFPLFEVDEQTGGITYGHNPFSLPTEATLELIESDPLAVRGAQYDL
ncbi:MAG: aspartate--tRNA ligase, partial [Actinobacteria bacterium]|nr:aspartate--tRNA ligase [Actinomycetota bacterium]